MVNQETIKAIISMSVQRLSGRKIAEQLNLDRKTVYKYIHEHRDEIEAEKYADLEEFSKETGLLKLDRLKRLSQFREQVDEAVAEIDFKTLKPEFLLLLNLRVEKQIAEEVAKISLFVGEEKRFSRYGEAKSSKELKLMLDS